MARFHIGSFLEMQHAEKIGSQPIQPKQSSRGASTLDIYHENSFTNRDAVHNEDLEVSGKKKVTVMVRLWNDFQILSESVPVQPFIKAVRN